MDFREKRDYRYNSNCVKDGLLSNVIIYGPNASGKSNLGFALFDIVNVLTDKHTEPFARSSANFINMDGDSSRARFEYVFKKDNDMIGYTYEKTSPNQIVYEELKINEEKAFSYDFETKEMNIGRMDLIEAESLNFEYLEENFSVVRYIANNKPQSEGSYIRFIMRYVSHMLWFRSLKENGYIGFATGKHILLASNELMRPDCYFRLSKVKMMSRFFAELVEYMFRITRI